MRHAIRLDGFALALRPVERADAAFIVQLRTDPHLCYYIHPTSPDVADQEAWLDRYFVREGDYYFVVEQKASGEREGLAGIYNVNAEGTCAEWGRWILRPGSMGAIESALLVYTVAFEQLGLEEVYCRTMIENKQAVSFHRSCGLEERTILPKYLRVGMNEYDAIEQYLTRARWQFCRHKLSRHAERIARRAFTARGAQG